MTEQVRFEVGEKYENMKGIFEVIAIHRDSMEIRWESGEEISTSIALQQRIIERMQHELELEKAEAGKKTKKAKARSGKSAKPFAGLEEGDFGVSVTKTIWRGRGQLGGAVARRMKSQSFKFNSWAVLSQPEVHWLDVKRQKASDLSRQAKFYVLVGEESLGFGFHLPRAADGAAKSSDWQHVLNWLEGPENDRWLRDQCASLSLYIYASGGQGLSGTIESRDDAWVHRKPDGQEIVIDPLNSALSAAAGDADVDLRIEKRMNKAAAIEKGADVADAIAELFMVLMPLYTAAAAPGT